MKEYGCRFCKWLGAEPVDKIVFKCCPNCGAEVSGLYVKRIKALAEGPLSTE